jgi:hypothetical protein
VFTWCLINSLKATSIIKSWNKDNPSHAQYIQMWDASLLLKYYITTCPVEPEDESFAFEFFQFLLQKTISLIAFFCLLRPIEIIQLSFADHIITKEVIVMYVKIKSNSTNKDPVFIPLVEDERISPYHLLLQVRKILLNKYPNIKTALTNLLTGLPPFYL